MADPPLFYKAPRYLFRKLNILRTISNKKIDSFIDVGCGAGELACSLAESGIKGVGLDFSDAAIKTATKMRKRRGIKPSVLNFYVDNGSALNKERHDLVICCEVLEHIKDDEKLLRKLIQSSNRYLLLSVPAKQKLYDSSDAAVGHFRRYEKPDFVNLIERNGLEIIEFKSYGFPFTNIVRLIRKFSFALKLRTNKLDSMDERSKKSGINPIKPPKTLSNIDIETLIKPLFHFSRLFNRTNLSEGYLVLCKKK